MALRALTRIRGDFYDPILTLAASLSKTLPLRLAASIREDSSLKWFVGELALPRLEVVASAVAAVAVKAAAPAGVLTAPVTASFGMLA